MRARWLGIFAALLIPQPAIAEPPIRFAVGNSWAAPFAEFQGERLVGGILLDLAQALATETRRPIVQVPLPRKRLELAAKEGSIDIHCYFNPKWSDSPNDYLWSAPLFDIPDVVVGHRSAPEVRSITEIANGSVVGAVIGYVYPEVDPEFVSGRLRREDAIDQVKVLLKLNAGRHPYGLSNQRAADWFKRTTPGHNLAAWSLPIAKADFYCAVPKNQDARAGELISALERLRASGKIKQILAAYR